MPQKHMELRPVDHDAGRLLGRAFQTLHVDDHRRHQSCEITLADPESRSESDRPGLDPEPGILRQQGIDRSRQCRRLDAGVEVPKQRLLHQCVPPGTGIGRDSDVPCIEQRPEPRRRLVEAIRVRFGDREVMPLPLREPGADPGCLEIGVRDPRRDLGRRRLDRCMPGRQAVRDQHLMPWSMRRHRILGRIDRRHDRRGGLVVALGKQRLGKLKLGRGIDVGRLNVGTVPERRQNRDEGHRDERELPGSTPNDVRGHRHVARRGTGG